MVRTLRQAVKKAKWFIASGLVIVGAGSFAVLHSATAQADTPGYNTVSGHIGTTQSSDSSTYNASGVTVRLIDTAGYFVKGSTTTDSNGDYSLTVPTSSTYVLQLIYGDTTGGTRMTPFPGSHFSARIPIDVTTDRSGNITIPFDALYLDVKDSLGQSIPAALRMTAYAENVSYLPSPFAGTGQIQIDDYSNSYDEAPNGIQYRPVIHGVTYGVQISNTPTPAAYAQKVVSNIAISGQPLAIAVTNVLGVPTRLDAPSPTYAAPALTWNYPPSGNNYYDADHFNVYRNGALIGTANDREYTDNSLAQSGTYSYQVAAVNYQGTISGRSSAVSVEYHSALPSAPGSISVTSPAKQPVLTWSPVTAASSYTVYRDGVSLATATAATYTDTTASNGSHSYYVVSNNSSGSSSPSDTVTAITDTTRPDMSFTAPTSFAGPFTTGPVVSVVASDSSGLGSMAIHVYTSTNQLLTTCGSATAAQLSAGAQSCDLSGLANGSYYIKAGSFDNASNNRTIASPTFTISH